MVALEGIIDFRLKNRNYTVFYLYQKYAVSSGGDSYFII